MTLNTANPASRPEPSTWVDLGHARIPVWIEGSGPPVVFVHGWPLTSETWSGVIAAMGHPVTAITFDLPGAGQSEWQDSEKLSLTALSSAVVAVVREVSPVRPVVLCGHDSGGGLARSAAVELGALVAGMVLGNTEIPGVHSWRFSMLMGGMRVPGAQALTAAAIRTSVGRALLLRDAVADRSRVPSLAERFLLPLAETPRRLEGALAVIDGVRASDFDAIGACHPKITCPVQLIWGAECRWFPLEGARAMGETFGGPTQLLEVPGAGLLVHEEQPAVFARTLDAFMKTLTPR